MRPAALAVAALLVSGCASSPVMVQTTNPALHAANVGGLAHCAISLGTLADKRPSTAAGVLHGRAIEADALTERLRELLLQAGVQPEPTDEGGQLDVEIVHTYGQGKSTSKSFTTVLRGRLGDEELIARGVNTGINWTGSAGEVSRGLMLSFDDATAQLVESVASRCAEETGVGRSRVR